MSTSSYNLVGLIFRGIFYMGFISHCRQQSLSKGSVCLTIPIIVRFITIWYEVFFKLILSFDVLVSMKKIFLDSSHLIETHLDVIV